jgi:outer membrane protein
MNARRLLYPLATALALTMAVRAPAQPATPLSLADARALALRSHPSITMAELGALVAKEVTTENNAAFYPLITANAAAVGVGETVTRISSAGLDNSQIYNHVGAGATVRQLLLDFGRTSNLTAAARSQARAADANVLAVRAQLLLAVDDTYFGALEARAVLMVANTTLKNRQLLSDQVAGLAKNQLRSDLDARIAATAVDEARLLVDKADDDWQSALATLTSLVGRRALVTAGQLVDEPTSTAPFPADAESLADLALQQRPELLRQRAVRDAAHNVASAAAEARLPVISALAAAGVVPVRDDHFQQNYAAAGVNVSVPLFAGGLYQARQREAELEAGAADAAVLEAELNLVRDVRLAWLEADHARARIALTASLLANAGAALDLAQARFAQGLISIVELNQAELSQVSAAIANANAKYDFQIRRDLLDYQTGSLR